MLAHFVFLLENQYLLTVLPWSRYQWWYLECLDVTTKDSTEPSPNPQKYLNILVDCVELLV